MAIASAASKHPFLAADEASALIAAYDWTRTSLGPLEAWPQALKTTAGFLLRSPAPMVLLWGADGVMLYNDAYSVFAGGRHPRLLGSKVREGWPEVAEFNDNVMKVGLAGGTLAYRDQELTLHRNGAPEKVWMNLDYSPVPDERGRPAGVLAIVVETTERVLAERRASGGILQRAAILGQLAEGVIVTDSQGRIVFVNEAAERLHGVKMLGVAPSDYSDAYRLLTPDGHPYPPRDLPLARAVLDGETVTDARWRIRRAEGEEILAIGSARPITGSDGTTMGAVLTLRDDTERASAEERLREQSRTLEILNRTGKALAGELDLERLVQRVTDAAVEITGAQFGAFFYNVQNEVGDSLMLYTLSGAKRSAFDGFEMPRATAVFRPTFEGEGVIRSHDILSDPRYGKSEPHKGMPAGHLPVRSYLAVPVISRSSEVLGGLFFGHERPGVFSERHERLVTGLAGQAAVAVDNARLFQTIQRLNETLAARVVERTNERDRVWEMSRDLFAIAGFDGHLRAINPAWEATLGFDKAALLSRPIRERVHPDDHPAIEAVFARLLRGETITGFENRHLHADGSWRWIAWGLVPEGEVYYSVGRDVTAEKEAAAELERAQEALRQSQKMEAIGHLTGGVAHDFNNLLTPIVGVFDMLQRRGVGSEREQQLIAGAMQAADRAKTVIQRLLAFARRQPLQTTAVDVAALVAGMGELVASTVGPQIRIVVQAPDDLPSAQADLNQLEMALLNLSVNARDAMPDGGTLRISAAAEIVGPGHRSKLQPGSYVRLSIADTGTGMDRSTLARSIEPFFSTKGIGKGTGLGLSMVHGLAAQLGGALTIQSQPGVGTNVELWLPSSAAPVPTAEPAAEAPAVSVTGTALVVDDEPLVRMGTADMLDELGYAVVEANSAEEALKLVNGGLRPDLLVTDHLMPGMNGTDLAQAVRADHPDIHILIVSGYADLEAIAPDLPRLLKPFRSADLAASVASLEARGGS